MPDVFSFHWTSQIFAIVYTVEVRLKEVLLKLFINTIASFLVGSTATMHPMNNHAKWTYFKFIPSSALNKKSLLNITKN
jgi:hypothetical protein